MGAGRGLGRLLATLLGIACLVGCAADRPAPAPTTASHDVPRPGPGALPDARTLLLNTPGPISDPAVESVVAMVRDNLAQFEVTASHLGRTASLPPPRRAALGPTATVSAMRVETRVAGEPRAVAHTVWVTTTGVGEGTRVAGFADGPAAEPTPLWLMEPITVRRGPAAAVVATAAHDPGPWLDGLERSAADLRGAGLAPSLVVAELPRNSLQLQRIVGGPQLGAAGAGCWAFGDGVRILVNPGPGAATGGSARQFLLTHEAVHAATDSPHHRWPAWFVEGYADHVAASAHPEVGRVLDDQLRDALRAGAPATLPTAHELDPTRPQVAVAYARARVGVRLLGDAASRVQTDLGHGASIDDALRNNGWTAEGLAAATAAELGRMKG